MNYIDINYNGFADKLDAILKQTNKQLICKQIILATSDTIHADLKAIRSHKYVKKKTCIINNKPVKCLVFKSKGIAEYAIKCHINNLYNFCRYFKLDYDMIYKSSLDYKIDLMIEKSEGNDDESRESKKDNDDEKDTLNTILINKRAFLKYIFGNSKHNKKIKESTITVKEAAYQISYYLNDLAEDIPDKSKVLYLLKVLDSK